MSTQRTEQITTEAGGQFDGYAYLPGEDGNGNGILLIQEIFGVGEYIRTVAARLADLGYVVLAPDLYWRIERGVTLGNGEEDREMALSYAGKFDMDKGVEDCGAALAHLRDMSEVKGMCGVLGFCFGGTLAFLTAASHEPDAAVSYYGSGVPALLDRTEDITCPLLLHFGGKDRHISRDAIIEVEKRAAPRKGFEVHIQEDAGHAFDNHLGSTHHPQAAAAAWGITVEFLKAHL